MKKTGIFLMMAVMIFMTSCTESSDFNVNELTSRQAESALNEMTDINSDSWMNGVHVKVTSGVKEENGLISGVEETFVLSYRPELLAASRATEKDNTSSSTSSSKKKTVVRTTIKIVYMNEYTARSGADYKGMTPLDYLMVMVRENESLLKSGGSVSFKVTLLLDGLQADTLYNAIQVPPYSIYIEDGSCK